MKPSTVTRLIATADRPSSKYADSLRLAAIEAQMPRSYIESLDEYVTIQNEAECLKDDAKAKDKMAGMIWQGIQSNIGSPDMFDGDE